MNLVKVKTLQLLFLHM